MEQSPLDDVYRLALTTLRNVNGQWRAPDEQTLTGNGMRAVYELPRNTDLQLAMQSYHQQLQLAGATPLFACSGHRCGSSSSWANEYFSDRRLYGLDQFQRFASYQIKGEQGDTVVVLYAVTRGNQRSYLLFDQFNAVNRVNQTPSIDTLKTLLDEGQRFELPILLSEGQWRVQEDYLALVQRLLKTEPTTKLALVVTDYRNTGLDNNLANSKAIGIALAQQIEAQSKAGRIRVEGIGSLAPIRRQQIDVWLLSYR
ncbi:hypothetical protein GCM10025791_00600 [Halioxenophilus aromaticivorans]|uniref:DUF4892 domain-containing protein n=1 Tax=Halioxenophilus aromaticivorans TaxID=1306992 RepID=A0AAV3TWC8_9ALTE